MRLGGTLRACSIKNDRLPRERGIIILYCPCLDDYYGCYINESRTVF